MIAMQYSFALPADYDMDIIDRRVAEKGHALDHHPPLVFKAYCVARRSEPALATNENLYAPFYLWRDTLGMNDFLSGPGFKALTQSFGWPSVKTWPIVLASEVQAIAGAQYATRSRPLLRHSRRWTCFGGQFRRRRRFCWRKAHWLWWSRSRR